eukprot:9456080-Prorocentrum_lima.AAC.1
MTSSLVGSEMCIRDRRCVSASNSNRPAGMSSSRTPERYAPQERACRPTPSIPSQRGHYVPRQSWSCSTQCRRSVVIGMLPLSSP